MAKSAIATTLYASEVTAVYGDGAHPWEALGPPSAPGGDSYAGYNRPTDTAYFTVGWGSACSVIPIYAKVTGLTIQTNMQFAMPSLKNSGASHDMQVGYGLQSGGQHNTQAASPPVNGWIDAGTTGDVNILGTVVGDLGHPVSVGNDLRSGNLYGFARANGSAGSGNEAYVSCIFYKIIVTWQYPEQAAMIV